MQFEWKFVFFLSSHPSQFNIESISTSEGPDANGLYTEKAMLSVILTRKEMAAAFECRIETEALETTVRYQLKVDLQGKPIQSYFLTINIKMLAMYSLHCAIFYVRPHLDGKLQWIKLPKKKNEIDDNFIRL